jgi:hypothetical protein
MAVGQTNPQITCYSMSINLNLTLSYICTFKHIHGALRFFVPFFGLLIVTPTESLLYREDNAS